MPPTFRARTSTPDLLALATRDSDGRVYLLVANGSSTGHRVRANLGSHFRRGTGITWRYSATEPDVVVSHPSLVNGRATFRVPAVSAVLVRFTRNR